MSHSYLYISDGSMFVHTDNQDHPIRSEVLETYIRKIRDSANRTEWKRSGSGAMFTNPYQPGADAQSRVAAVNAAVNAFNRELIDHHLHQCVARDLREGKEEVLDELAQTLHKLMK